MDSVCDLISTSYTADDCAVQRATDTPRRVFCRVESASRFEFSTAGRNGYKPEFKIVMFAGDYNGESTLILDGLPYAVYRTYHVPGTDNMELYVERKGGVNGKENIGRQAVSGCR